jgi:hypothetical protein
MTEEQDAAGKTVDLEAEVWNAISAFEQILEAMPEDRTSLEALAGAYEQIGDLVRARDYLLRLATVVVKVGDGAAAGALAGRLDSFARDDERAAELLKQVRALEEAAPVPADAREQSRGEILRKRIQTGFNMAEGISFAWNLMEQGDLTEADYAAIVRDLTEMSVSPGHSTVSVFHVLEARAFKGLERILTRCGRDWGVPVITLGGFELQYPVVTQLPYELVVRCGVLPFETCGNHYLVAMMSPYDSELRRDVETVLGQQCHVYLTLPSEFDQAVVRLATLIEGHETEAATEEESGDGAE